MSRLKSLKKATSSNSNSGYYRIIRVPTWSLRVRGRRAGQTLTHAEGTADNGNAICRTCTGLQARVHGRDLQSSCVGMAMLHPNHAAALTLSLTAG